MDIKELAEQAGANVLETSAWTIIQLNTGDQTKFLERFAELILEQERKEAAEHYLKLIRDCVATEREQCAQVCEGLTGRSYEFDMGRLHSAAAIRARGDKHD